MPSTSQSTLASLTNQLSGKLLYDDLSRRIYATDASIFRELPLAIAIPANEEDLITLVRFANEQGLSLIPRASGTSLAGQCVGSGIVVELANLFSDVLDINKEEQWVVVQPGVIRDELNRVLQPHGLYFGPNTSTSNRATIGGMVGNNSCGSTSIEYGTTRDHVISLKAILSDGSKVTFGPVSEEELVAKCQTDTLEGKIYQQIRQSLQDPERQQAVREHFPKPGVTRRNTGYAVDLLLRQRPFNPSGSPFNLSTLVCGSEGTLAFVTEIKLRLDPLPQPENVVLAAHFNSVSASLKATLVAMNHQPSACELMDKVILDCTKEHPEHEKNRSFVEGDPQAILLVEFKGATLQEAELKAKALEEAFLNEGMGYAFPVVYAPDSSKVWELRKAGLGLLSNVKGDAKPVACIEDTAVALEDLPAYIAEFEQLMEGFGQQAVYYAHAGAGELHLRPILNLKSKEGRAQLLQISEASARLVKKYRGSLSGEHGDGRLRASFIQEVLGLENLQLFQEIKNTWDPGHIFNPGKILNPPPLTESLRYQAEQPTPPYETAFDFAPEGGILRAAEKCNGSGDCRKLPTAGGTMCPSYQATRQEKDTTRARANALREYLTTNGRPGSFHRDELKEVMDLCLGCKACATECPSQVDMASMKAEWQHQQHRLFRSSFRDRVFSRLDQINTAASSIPALSNVVLSNWPFSRLNKSLLGIAQDRSLPRLSSTEFLRWWKRKGRKLTPNAPSRGSVVLYADEFTRFYDARIGIKAVKLLLRLGYTVDVPEAPFSARAQISKGFLNQAMDLAEKNVKLFHPLVHQGKPLLGIEPSAILGFRDEFPRLLRGPLQEQAKNLSEHVFLIEEFLIREVRSGRLGPEDFSKEHKQILLHGHCHQKALSDFQGLIELLSVPEHYHVELIPSGCCGMAGSFGYEKEHFDLSMKIGEMVLFPALRAASSEQVIVASGTSCRHQILDGVGREAIHPVEIL